MTNQQKRRTLGTTLALVGAPFLLMALLATCMSLWLSWQLDGGAAAVNEAGRMRMQAYRMALTVGGFNSFAAQEQPQQIQKFNASLALLRQGDASRPLQVPWDGQVRQHFARVESDWQQFQAQWLGQKPVDLASLEPDTVAFVAHIDALVSSIEEHMSAWTTALHMLQTGVLVLALLAAAILLFAGYRFVLEPVHHLELAIRKIQSGDFAARVNRVGSDEFGTLARGFNGMAEHLQSMYGNLESKVREKTFELEEKNERLESLYAVTALVSHATCLEALANEFSHHIQAIAKADGVAVRWSDPAQKRYLLLASSGLPQELVDDERCLAVGDCYCGVPTHDTCLSVIPIAALPQGSRRHCVQAGFKTIVNVPVRVQERQTGEVNLFFHSQTTPSVAERSLLEALNRHFASAMENLRLNALEREAAVSEERHHLSRELHDSIAQSLAFLKIQVQLMRDAVASRDEPQMQTVLEEIDVGVRECYGDVRELLVNFRTRTNDEHIETALATTLRKFELQSGLSTDFDISGRAAPLSADVKIQVLHIVQEALSNVRKHAQASRVWLTVQQQPSWSFEVRDNGVGFAAGVGQRDETHIGLHIMSERAQRIGAAMEIISTPGQGCSVRLVLSNRTSVVPQAPVHV
jgi:two-component system nitrate/nitrite sensor histidine kinase NarX